MTAHPYRDDIPPVESGPRPQWSVMIPTYNNDDYLPRTLTAVLEQALPADEMQIEVVDDCSTAGDAGSLVRKIAGDRVAYFRQPANLGVAQNLSNCIARSRGQLVHLLHGDDFVLPGFYERLGQGFAAAEEIGLAFCRYSYIDQNGTEIDRAPLEQKTPGPLPDRLRRLASEQRICAPSVVVRRTAYERLGGFDRRLRCTEDWEMWVRIAAAFPVWYEPATLACYRMHDAGNTGRNVSSGDDMAYTGKAIDLFADYLPAAIAGDVTRRARETYACAALDMAYSLWQAGDRRAARAQLGVAFRLRRSPRVAARFLQLFGRGLLSWATDRKPGGRTA